MCRVLQAGIQNVRITLNIVIGEVKYIYIDLSCTFTFSLCKFFTLSISVLALQIIKIKYTSALKPFLFRNVKTIKQSVVVRFELTIKQAS